MEKEIWNTVLLVHLSAALYNVLISVYNMITVYFNKEKFYAVSLISKHVTFINAKQGF